MCVCVFFRYFIFVSIKNILNGIEKVTAFLLTVFFVQEMKKNHPTKHLKSHATWRVINGFFLLLLLLKADSSYNQTAQGPTAARCPHDIGACSPAQQGYTPRHKPTAPHTHPASRAAQECCKTTMELCLVPGLLSPLGQGQEHWEVKSRALASLSVAQECPQLKWSVKH